jgi:hypothetical protein
VEAISTIEPSDPSDAASTQKIEPVTTELTSPLAATDRCPNCGARMAPDQRYCIECGERRTGGGLRDALPKTPAVAAATPPTRRSFFSNPNSSLIAGVATLLIALGVGVLIGRTGHSNNASASKPQVVTVQSSGGTAGTANTAATTAGTAAAATKVAKHHAKKSAAKATHQTALQKTAAKSGVKLPPPVVKVGSKCTAGAKGCQGGKFTGNFFGGG